MIEVFVSSDFACAGVVAYARELAASCPGSIVQVRKVDEREAPALMGRLHLAELPALVVDGVALPCCSAAARSARP